MTRLGRYVTLGCMLLTCLVGMSEPAAAADVVQRDDVVQRIVLDWQRRQRMADRYVIVMKGEHTIARGAHSTFLPPGTTGIAPEHDLASEIECKLEIDLANNCARKEFNRLIFLIDEKRYVDEFNVWIFDGHGRYVHRPKERNPERQSVPPDYRIELLQLKKDGPYSVFESWDKPLEFALGLIRLVGESASLPTYRRDVLASGLGRAGSGQIGDREHVILRTVPTGPADTFEEFWVDPARDSAVARWIRYRSGHPTQRFDAVFAQYAAGIWLPAGWEFAKFDVADGTLLESQRMEVVTVTVDPQLDQSRFQIRTAAGTVVYDDTTDATWLTDESPQGKRPIKDVVQEYRRSTVQHNGTWWFVLAGLLMGIVAVFAILRAHRLSQRSSGLS